MSEDILNLIADLLDNEGAICINGKYNNFKVQPYYDIENIKHIKLDFGYESYIISVD